MNNNTGSAKKYITTPKGGEMCQEYLQQNQHISLIRKYSV